MNQTPTWYEVEDVARVLSCHRSTVTRLCDSGALQCVWVGRQRRITREALAAYMDGETPPAASSVLYMDDYSTDPPTANLLADSDPEPGSPDAWQAAGAKARAATKAARE